MKHVLGSAMMAGTIIAAGTAWAAGNPPTITASNVTKECAGTTTSVFINAKATDDTTPLPTITYTNALGNKDPDDYPLGTKGVTVRACDETSVCATKPVAVSVVDTTPPSVNLGVDKLVECTSPNGTPVTFPASPATDVCDSTLTMAYSVGADPAPAGYPVGSTTVQGCATDDSGRKGCDTIVVNVQDTKPPVVDAGPDFTVLQRNDCNNNTGTLVRLPAPVVTEACTAQADLVRINSFNNTNSQSVCLPVGTTSITWSVYDKQGQLGTDTLSVRVDPAASLGVNVTVSGPQGFQPGNVNITATPSNHTLPVTWTVGADVPPGVKATNATTGVFTATFSAEAVYCPLYLSVVDAASKRGADNSRCFAIDKTAPTITFTGVATTTRSATNPNTVVPTDPANPTTYPLYFAGEEIPVEHNAFDEAGTVKSGLARIRVYAKKAGVETLIHDQTFCTASPTGLATCGTRQLVTTCNQTTAFCRNGRVIVGAFGNGNHAIRIEATDLAGNVTNKEAPFRVGDLSTALAQVRDWSNALWNNAATPAGAITDLKDAERAAKTGVALFTASLGHTFVLARKAWLELENAGATGLVVTYMKETIARGLVAQASRAVDVTAAQNLTDWAILRNWPDGTLPRTGENYTRRTVLLRRGDVDTDFVVEVGPTLMVASQYSDLARQKLATDQTAAMSAGQDAWDSIVMLYRDQTMVAMYGTGYTPQEVAPGVPEAYYFGSRPGSFGNNIAKTVFRQINRVVDNPELTAENQLPPAVVTELRTAQTNITTFSNAVTQIEQAGWDVTNTMFGNEEITRNVYLSGILALEALNRIPTGSVYTHTWVAAITLVVAYVGNFTIYEGPTSLYRLQSYLMGDQGGGVYQLDTQTSECRLHRVAAGLAAGRIKGNVTSAAELYVNTKCLTVQIYNKYYAKKFLMTDDPITPSTYGCGTADIPLVFTDECPCIGAGGAGVDATCNGLDEDCDGRPDDNYVQVSCGQGPCASTSVCINGREVPCVPGEPAASVDITCNAVDEDCDGTKDDDWQPTTCGFGGCTSQSSCNNGVVTACVAPNAGSEVCDGSDNDCDVAVDEGLDNDRDGYGCRPTSALCVRTANNDRLCPKDKNASNVWTGVWDCDDFNSRVNPANPEICDYLDNNCNNTADEGVLNECGHCEGSCSITKYGVGGQGFNPTPTNSEGVAAAANGTVGLATETVSASYAWIANSGHGTVSRLDTVTGKEVGRYCQAVRDYAHGSSSVCSPCHGCNYGSRTAVDVNGNMFIANRAFGYQGHLTKIANLTRDCVDRNGNGSIQTSKDANNNGIIDEGQYGVEYWGQEDECILFTKPAGCANCYPRALAIDPDGDPWVGLFHGYSWGGGFWEMNPTTGAQVRFKYMAMNPYGAVVDSQGILWSGHSAGGGCVQSFNTRDVAVSINNVANTAVFYTWPAFQVSADYTGVSSCYYQPWGDYGNYGIAVDGLRRVYVAGHPATTYAASRFDPRQNQWVKANTPAQTGRGYGRGVTVDASGILWVSQHNGGARLTAFRTDTLDGTGQLPVYQKVLTNGVNTTMDFNLYSSAVTPIGVGIGAGGKVWTANGDSRNATVLDPNSGAIGFYPVGGYNYTYSDFTGNLLRTFTAPRGTYTEKFEACQGGVKAYKWLRLSWTGIQPAGTKMQFRARVASTLAGLASAPWFPGAATYWEPAANATPGQDISAVPATWNNAAADARYMELEVTLVSSPAGTSPTLESYKVVRDCAPPPG